MTHAQPDKGGYLGSKKPYLSASVVRGLLSMIKKTRVEDSDELVARLWIYRIARYREQLSSGPLTAQDARRCLQSAPGPDSQSGLGEETKETP